MSPRPLELNVAIQGGVLPHPSLASRSNVQLTFSSATAPNATPSTIVIDKNGTLPLASWGQRTSASFRHSSMMLVSAGAATL